MKFFLLSCTLKGQYLPSINNKKKQKKRNTIAEKITEVFESDTGFWTIFIWRQENVNSQWNRKLRLLSSRNNLGKTSLKKKLKVFRDSFFCVLNEELSVCERKLLGWVVKTVFHLSSIMFFFNFHFHNATSSSKLPKRIVAIVRWEA